MQIAFYGISHHVGTSANMAAVHAAFVQGCPRSLAFGQRQQEDGCHTKPPVLTKISKSGLSGAFCAYDLVAVNLSIPCRELEEIYVLHSLVRKNVIFLIGKYHQNQKNELDFLIRHYRLDPARVCAIPYNQRFAKAYGGRNVSAYCRSISTGGGSYEDAEFHNHLSRAVRTMLILARGFHCR